MCGIVGRFNFRSGAPVSLETVRRMRDLLQHRGPDAADAHVDGPAGLGHRRLAIIDLSDAGRQPMCTADRRLWITFNGEIYNYQELRRELAGRGYTFGTQTDTEVILAAYREFGADCLARLRGMFAFLIWDATEHTLFAARDRLGKKPLYYRFDRDGIVFASEPKAFLGEAGFSPEPDLHGISAYLTYQYVPSPLTAFKDVHKLPPAHYIRIRDGRCDVQRYWRLSYEPKLAITETEAREEIVRRLQEAVRLRLISDVPLGAFLSGGIDSATVVALMAACSSTVKTFSIGFDEEEFDELEYARLVAKRFGTDHHEFVVRPDAVSVLPVLAWHYGEPFADGSAIPTYYLAQMTRQHVTVALTGDGGDENFAGYARYVPNVVPTHYARLPAIVRDPVHRMVRVISPFVQSRVFDRLREFWREQSEPRERRYARWMAHFGPADKAAVCRPEFFEATGGDRLDLLVDAFRQSQAADYVDATLDVDVQYYLPDDLLVKVDIATMAHALEARCPLVDHEFMEFAASLPAAMKLNGTVKKYIFKQAVRGLIPDEIIDRRKMGFAVPLGDWFRRDLRELAYDLFLSDRFAARGYFDTQKVRRLLDDHVQGRADHRNRLFNLLMLELWHRSYIDAPVRQPELAPQLSA